ncbi:hypothetical protein [Rubripirellula amarantea]|nr:hypothetical protein [Rubripirellula amarantea]
MPDKSMAYRKLSELLPVKSRDNHGSSSSSYNAYEVFGLEMGESDTTKITTSINALIAKLKAVKSESEPSVWATAAKLVQASRVILLDKEKKAALDAQLGIARSAPTPTSGSTDPLASLLPVTDPLASVLPPTPPRPQSPTAAGSTPKSPVESESSMPPGLFQGPAVTPDGSPIMRNVDEPETAGTFEPQPAIATTAAGNDPVVPKLRAGKPKIRRRKSRLGPMVMGIFTLALLAIVAVLVHFMYFSDGTLAISRSEKGITISTTPPPSEVPTVVNQPLGSSVSPATDVRPAPAKPRDPVMGNLAGNVPLPPRPTQPSPSMGDSSNATPPTESNVAIQPMPVDSPMPVAAEVTEEMRQQAEQRLAEIRSIIKTANWEAMKSIADQDIEIPMTNQQKEAARTLHNVCELSTFYRGAIEMAIPNLNTGEDLAVTENNRYVVVGKRNGILTVQADGGQKSFSIDELPMGLAHKIAAFKFDEGVLLTACRAIYQAVCAKATIGERRIGIEKLRQMPESPEGTDTQQMADMIESIWFGSPE